MNSEAVQDRILQSAGRAARRVVQQKISSEYSEFKSDRESTVFEDNEKQILAMENFNGLQEWTARADSMKELIRVAVDLEDPPEIIQQLRRDYREFLQVPFVNVKSTKNNRQTSTPASAPPKNVHNDSNQLEERSDVDSEV